MRKKNCFVAAVCLCTSCSSGIQTSVTVPVAGPVADTLPAAIGPGRAHEWRRLAWKDENGQIDPDGLRRALLDRQANVEFSNARAAEQGRAGQPLAAAGLDPLAWQEHGPNNVGGRTRSLVIHPTETNRMWAGSVGGGIWYSADGGAAWSPVNDWWASLAIGCLVIDPANPEVLYAGTGEGFFNADAIGGAGIFKSIDGGVTWDVMPSTTGFNNVCRIAISPDDSNVMLAGIRSGGIRRTVDGGATWTNVRSAQGSFYVAFDPTDGLKAIAHVLDVAGDWTHRALYSTDGGVTWLQAAPPLDGVVGFGSRIELAYAPSQPGIVFASVATDGGTIWRSLDGGQSYVQQTVSGTSAVNWYANPVWVDPTNPDVLLTGGYNVIGSLDGGVQLSPRSDGYIMTIQPHVDIHSFTHDPGYDGVKNRRIYVCNDGGVWMADDLYDASPVGGWTPRDQGYRTTQFYGAAGDGPSGLLIGGTQDNGTLKITVDDDQANLTFGGDGGWCAIDATDPSYTYGEYIFLQIHRSTNGGQSASYIYSGIGDAGGTANFIAPFILDPNNPNSLLAGGRSLWRSVDVKAPAPSWSAIRGPGTANISAIAVAPGNSDVIWIGQNNGAVYRTLNGTAGSPTWLVVDSNMAGSNPLPNRYVTRIVIDPDDSETVYLSQGGFSPANLWRTHDGGATWQDISGPPQTGLPVVPVRGVARHPHNPDWLYAATEVGVFTTDNGGFTWSTSDFGPAAVSVDELVFMHGSTTLLAATHGRGLWTIDLGRVGDIDGDGLVGITDFLALLAAWGPCPQKGPCDADLDGDGLVGIVDMLLLLANWG